MPHNLFAWKRVVEAALILDKSGTRAGFPLAWYSALTHLNRDIHVPPCARDDFTFLADEMDCCFEPVKSMDRVSDEHINRIFLAFQRIYCAFFTLTVLENIEAATREVTDEDTTLLVEWLMISKQWPDSRRLGEDERGARDLNPQTPIGNRQPLNEPHSILVKPYLG